MFIILSNSPSLCGASLQTCAHIGFKILTQSTNNTWAAYAPSDSKVVQFGLWSYWELSDSVCISSGTSEAEVPSKLQCGNNYCGFIALCTIMLSAQLCKVIRIIGETLKLLDWNDFIGDYLRLLKLILKEFFFYSPVVGEGLQASHSYWLRTLNIFRIFLLLIWPMTINFNS